MAGIAGWIAPARRAPEESRLAPMLAALAHRGTGTLTGVLERGAREALAMGATLSDPASRVSLALDGTLLGAEALRAELAARGFRFAGASQEEVLLRAYQYWDKDVVKRLRGAFAFAIWDARKARLMLARDRFGEKPLYLHEGGGRLHFASEPKALLAAGIDARVDLGALADCIALRYVPGPRTLFQGIRKLAPGALALWQLGRLHEQRYWTPPDAEPPANAAGGEAAVAEFARRLEAAVAAQGAEGVLLSGGLDSAVLVALASRGAAKPKTFAFALEGERSSELAAAAQVARHFGTAHEEIVLSPRALLAGLEPAIAARDAPLARPSDLAVHGLAREAAQRAKRVLAGDGCDEVLAGYRRYAAENLCGGVDAFPARLLAPLVHAGRFDSAAAVLRLKRWQGILLRQNRSAKEPSASFDARLSPVRRALYLDQTRLLPDHLLERNDRAAASAGLHLALPFLDHRLAEFVAALPDAERLRGLTTKRILRQAAARFLPPACARRPKRGWRIDGALWLRNELREAVLDHLRSTSSVTRRYYDAATLDRVLDEHLEGKNNHETLLWTLLNLDIWHRTYIPG